MNIETDLRNGIKSVTSEWTKEKLHNERVSRQSLNRYRYRQHTTTLKEVAWDVIPEAYRHASSNGKYFANARQIFYAARPALLERSDRRSIDSKYFTQTLLKDYLLAHEMDPDVMSWKIVWDARGHFKEPHTDLTIGVGGIDVLKYTEGSHDVIEYGDYEIHSLVQTKGNRNRYQSILFIEKEGFYEILEDAGIDREYDIAIVSTKGIPTDACMNLLSYLAADGCTVYAMHDFDLSGFKITKTLREGTKLTQGVEVKELGLRYEDLEGLPTETVVYSQKKDPRRYLYGCEATDEEIDLLVNPGSGEWNGWEGERVELNAMTSEQLITWLRGKLDTFGVGKYIPDYDSSLKNAYIRSVLLQKINEAITELEKGFDKDSIDIPPDLRERIRRKLEKKRLQSWDEAIWDISTLLTNSGH